VAETELDRLAKQLGSRREDVRRLLDIAARSADGARIAKNLLRARLRRAGMDPDDPSAFPLVDQLPPGSIRIGRVLNGDSEGPVLALPQGTAADVQHIGVFGPTRWGKTFILLHVSRQSMDLGGPCWIFDLEDEYARLAAAVVPERKPLILSLADLRMNLFQSPADTIHWQTWLDDLCLLLRQETFLRDGSLNLFNTEMRNLIASKVTQAGAPTYPSLAEVRDRIAGLKFGGGKIRSTTWLESIVNRLTMLCNTFEETAHVTRSDMLPRLAERSVIFRLRGLRGIPLQFLADFLLTWLSRYREVHSAPIPHLCVIEEVHLLLADERRIDIGSSTLSTLAATGAKRGIQLGLSNQLMSILPPAVLGNLGSRIVTRLTNPQCLWTAQRSMGMAPEQAARISELELREVIVQYGGHPSPLRVRVDELSFPPRPSDAEIQADVEAFLSEVNWTEDGFQETVPSAEEEPEAFSGDALLVFTRIAERPAELITDRRDALRMDCAREVRARKRLEAKGFIAQTEETLGNKLRFYQLTPKGIVWAKSHKLKVAHYKSGPVHEYLLGRVEKVLGALGTKFFFQRQSEIAREHGIEPDSVLHMPGGQRVIIEICCNNLDYDAQNLVKETTIEGVDMVLAVTPNRLLKEAMERAVEKCRQGQDSAQQPKPLILLDAGECLEPDFDWMNILERPL